MTSNDIASGESSAAQKLLQKHAQDPHHVTVEDVEDEDVPHTTPSAAAQPANDQPRTKNRLDTQSHELFPELGAPKGKSANVAPIWGAKSNANGKTNGSGPSADPKASAPAMFIPGRNVESITLEPQDIIPRNQLKRPIPDIIKDINRKSRANITLTNSSNGRLKFDATGPQDVAQQALKDLVLQIGTRVRTLCSSFFMYTLTFESDFYQGHDSCILSCPHYRTGRFHDQEPPGEDWRQDSTAKD